MTGLGKMLILAGLAVAALGVLVLAAGKIPLLGRLPGDFVWRRPGLTFYFPLATSLLLSALLSLLLWFFRR